MQGYQTEAPNPWQVTGQSRISYKVVLDHHPVKMQIDLQEPLIIDSVLLGGKEKRSFQKTGTVWYIDMPAQKKSGENNVVIYYSGKVHEAVRPPWQGGFIFTKDSLGRPWMSVLPKYRNVEYPTTSAPA